MLEFHTELLKEEIKLPFGGAVLNAAEKIINECKERKKGEDRQLNRKWKDLEGAAVIVCHTAGQSGIEKEEWKR